MKKIILSLIAAGLVAAPMTGREIKREQRGVWCSAFLGEWPSGKINSTFQVTQQTKNLTRELDKLQMYNFTSVNFHARSFCDAMYQSSYEPWSSYVTSSRGGEAPLLDPLQVIVDECHERGLELYAWVNPYRYSNSSSYYNSGSELDYENSHPDWLLIKEGDQIILNPGLPEVRQRIVDVCREIITNYDVDGLIFDDYFYTSGTSMTLDADLYNAYVAEGGTLSQADWRRENVNQMVADVYQMVVETKPYISFGISPAGSCNPPDIADYGLPASSMSDWQYNGIYSDPIKWLYRGIVDYVSPQVYWSTSGQYIPSTQWWCNAVEHFGRNITISCDANLLGDYRSDEMIQQQLVAREAQMADQSGLMFFSWKKLSSYFETVDGVNQPLGYFLKEAVYQSKALVPNRPWRNDYTPRMVANVNVVDGVLWWDESTDLDRYTIYAVPEEVSDAEFGCQPQYLEAIRYVNNFTLPEEKATGYRWAVAVYDRYGNEYAPLFAGATAGQLDAPVLSLEDNAAPEPLGRLSWESEGTAFKVEILACEDGVNPGEVLYTLETNDKWISTSEFSQWEEGKTFAWRVTASAPNKLNATSETHRVKAPAFTISAPVDGSTTVAETPTISWTKAIDGATYRLEIGTTNSFSVMTLDQEYTEPSVTFGECVLSTGTTYYARVTATYGEHSMTTPIVTFKTADVEYTDAPVLVSPAADGDMIFSNETVSVAPWHGMTSVAVEISESSSFPTRSGTVKSTLNRFATSTAELGNLKINSAALVDGQTYYVRARGVYSYGSKTCYTPYCDTRTFVYNAAAGVDKIGADIAEAEAVYYTLQGIRVARPVAGQIYLRVTAGKAEKIRY